MKITNEELYMISGGFTATYLNSLSRLLSTIIGWGQMIGTSLYRYKNNTYCR